MTVATYDRSNTSFLLKNSYDNIYVLISLRNLLSNRCIKFRLYTNDILLVRTSTFESGVILDVCSKTLSKKSIDGFEVSSVVREVIHLVCGYVTSL